MVQAFPQISKHHNPGLRNHLLRLFSRKATLLPHLNIEDFGQSTPLLLSIGARGRTHPKAWVAHDSRLLVFRHEAHRLHRTYLYGYKMRFNEDKHQVYATLEADSPGNGPRHAKDNIDMMPDRGILALLVQKDTLAILVKI